MIGGSFICIVLPHSCSDHGCILLVDFIIVRDTSFLDVLEHAFSDPVHLEDFNYSWSLSRILFEKFVDELLVPWAVFFANIVRFPITDLHDESHKVIS